MLKLRQTEVQDGTVQELGAHVQEGGDLRAKLLALAQRVGGLQLDQARKMKDHERENARLRQLVVDLSLKKQVLADVAAGPEGQRQQTL